MDLLNNLPPLTVNSPRPVWRDGQFFIGETAVKILEYSSNDEGWTDDLTSFHEDTAGDNHFIDKASRNDAIKQIKKHTNQKSLTILEIGCSSGFMLKRLVQEFPEAQIIGADVVYEPLVKLADEIHQVPLLRFDLLECPLPDHCIDVIVILNVLEHINNDDKALCEMFRILKPNGIAVIEVPAGAKLFDTYDKALKHYRRYQLSGLVGKLCGTGFEVLRKSHLGFFLYPAFAFVKKQNQKKADVDVEELTKKNIKQTGNSKVLHLLMSVEACLGKYLSYPFGIRNLVTCRKPILRE